MKHSLKDFFKRGFTYKYFFTIFSKSNLLDITKT